MQPLSIEPVTGLDKMQSGLLDWPKKTKMDSDVSNQSTARKSDQWDDRILYPTTNQKPGKRTNQKRGDFFYVRVPTICLVRESSLVFWIFWQTNTMQREHHQALTKNYVLLVNERPVGKVLDELVQNKIKDDEMREFIPDCRTKRNPADWQEYHEWYLLSTSTFGTTADYLGLHSWCCTLFGTQQIYFLRCPSWS